MGFLLFLSLSRQFRGYKMIFTISGQLMLSRSNPKQQLISVKKQCASCTINLCKFQNYKPSIFQAADKFILSPHHINNSAQIGLKYSNKLILEINGIPNHFKSMQEIEIVDNIILSSDYYNLKWPQPSKSYSI